MPNPPSTPPTSVSRSALPASPRARHLRIAWIVALAADALQWIFLPLFAAGALSPFDDVVDAIVALALWRLLGWHWAFLPAFAAELVPGVELVPSWTLACWLATRGRARTAPTTTAPPAAPPAAPPPALPPR